jgi:hypothetical protein
MYFVFYFICCVPDCFFKYTHTLSNLHQPLAAFLDYEGQQNINTANKHAHTLNSLTKARGEDNHSPTRQMRVNSGLASQKKQTHSPA